MKKRQLKKAEMYIDGASRGNPGPASVGIVLREPGAQEPVEAVGYRIGQTTNNIAEYYALILGLQEALIWGIKDLSVFTDSELLAKQFAGEYKIKEPSLQQLFLLIAHLKRGFTRLTLTHVPREQNRLADAEANKALDAISLF